MGSNKGQRFATPPVSPSLMVTDVDGLTIPQRHLTASGPVESNQAKRARDNSSMHVSTLSSATATSDLADSPLSEPEIFPETIPCTLQLTYDAPRKQDCLRLDQKIALTWFTESGCDILRQTVLSFVDECCNKAKGWTPYLRHGRIHVHAAQYLDIHNLDINADSSLDSPNVGLTHFIHDAVVTKVCRLIGTKSHANLKLIVDLNVSAVKLPPEKRDSYIKNLRIQLDEKVRKNIEQRYYISRADLAQFTTADVIEKTLRDDDTFCGDVDELKRKIVTQATKLFVACVQLDSLYQQIAVYISGLIALNFDDQRLPNEHELRKELRGPRAHSLTQETSEMLHQDRIIRQLEEQLPKCFAPNFRRDGITRSFKNFEILPINFPEGGSSESSLGEGHYGEVRAITIDPAHHYFPTNPRSQKFALKEFKNNDGEASAQFKAEVEMLRHFRKISHDFMVLDHASFTYLNVRQELKYCILFPFAELGNLKQYMENWKPPLVDRDSTVWLIEQAWGVAGAVRRIHNAGEPPETEEAPQHLQVAGQFKVSERGSAVHHDIKPENILVFRDSDGRPTFKISDYGCGKLLAPASNGVSRQTNVKGTKTYHAPEAMERKKVGRPMDMWALGCFYLELMIWMFGSMKPEAFRLQRGYVTRPGGQRISLDTEEFWWTNPDTTRVELRPIVSDQISDLLLHPKIQGNVVFEDLINLVIIRLLNPVREMRLKSRGACNVLDQIRENAKAGKNERLIIPTPSEADDSQSPNKMYIDRPSTPETLPEPSQDLAQGGTAFESPTDRTAMLTNIQVEHGLNLDSIPLSAARLRGTHLEHPFRGVGTTPRTSTWPPLPRRSS